MISATNGYDVANRQALRDKWDVSGFLKSKKVTKEKKPKIIQDINLNKNKCKKADVDAKNERLKIQRPVLERAKKVFGKTPWKNLSDAVDGIVTSSYLGCISRGVYSISNPNTWARIENAVIQREKEFENEKN
ncbi:MAG: hypothetical protein GAK29_01422 [Acinetobacter bereziniae]|uniref:Uncharacterized protein n=1 Tax=Acinetobacter bereziniae TaxID=106648 RepID=A0A833PG78_ACIBZ|nr:MAG: hypothetical protein GAK29_01422 [Acinetobacter bereziniae]